MHGQSEYALVKKGKIKKKKKQTKFWELYLMFDSVPKKGRSVFFSFHCSMNYVSILEVCAQLLEEELY